MITTSRSRIVATAIVAASSLLLAACGPAADTSAEPAAEIDVTDVETTDGPTDVAAPDPIGPDAADDAPDAADDAPDAADRAPDADVIDADCSAQGATIGVRPVGGMPAEVAAMRDFLLDAALRCDEQLLFTAIEESDGFTYSFGAEGDAIGYWWDLEAAGEEPFLRLAQVLGTTPALSDDELWVWPQVHTGRPEHTTDAAWAELTWLEDPAATRAAPEGYLDWRVGISTDGDWRFFVAGD